MGTARKVVKYSTVGAVTALNAGAAYVALTGQDVNMIAPKRVAITAAAMTVLTWIVALT